MPATDIFPAGVTAPGANRVQFYPTAAIATAPTLAEVNAVSGLDITPYLPTDWTFKMSQDRIDDTRFSDSSAREAFGTATYDLNELSHIVAPQTLGTVTGNLALGTLADNTFGYIAIRLGKAAASAMVATDKVDVYSIQFGLSHTAPVNSGKFRRTITCSISKVVGSYILPAS